MSAPFWPETVNFACQALSLTALKVCLPCPGFLQKGPHGGEYRVIVCVNGRPAEADIGEPDGDAKKLAATHYPESHSLAGQLHGVDHLSGDLGEVRTLRVFAQRHHVPSVEIEGV